MHTRTGPPALCKQTQDLPPAVVLAYCDLFVDRVVDNQNIIIIFSRAMSTTEISAGGRATKRGPSAHAATLPSAATSTGISAPPIFAAKADSAGSGSASSGKKSIKPPPNKVHKSLPKDEDLLLDLICDSSRIDDKVVPK